MTIEKQTRRTYTLDFKRDAVALVTEQGYAFSQAARSLDINDPVLRRWKREFEEQARGQVLTVDEREELKRLRKENRGMAGLFAVDPARAVTRILHTLPGWTAAWVSEK